MRLLNRIFFIFPSTRGISQVTSTGLIGRKGRASLVFSIFTIILVLNVFISSASYTMQTSLVDGYEWRTYGNDILVNTVTPSTDIIDEIMSIDGVEQVFSFRSAWNPVFYDYPSPDNADFDINDAIRMRYIIEITPQTLNPSGDWGGDSYPISFEAINDKVGYDWSLDATPPQHKDLSIDIIDDIFENRTLAQTINYKSENGSNVAISMEQYTVLGGFFADTDQDVYIQGKNSENPIISMKRVTRSIDFLGPCDGFGCSIMISPKIADQLEIFDYITEPNLFLVKTSNAYKDKDNNLLVSQLIGKRLNDLDDPTSLSSEKGILIGATTRVIYTVIKDFWGTQAAFWDFLATFAVMGLIIGSAGMIIIAIRSVSERIREIGMMRAIGFSKKAVIYSVIYEMVTLALLGLSTGILNGILLTEMFTNKMMLVESAYPTNLLILYSVLVVGVSLIAAIIPGYRASQVPPSSALRYNG